MVKQVVGLILSVVDDIDDQIIGLLRANARMPLRAIADAVTLSPAPVKRRIERLEESGVIEGYTAIVNFAKAGSQLEAFAEIRLPGATDVDAFWATIKETPEVEQMFTIAGDPDALIRIRVGGVEHLQRVVNDLRRTGSVASTKTLIVLNSWQRR